MKMEGVIDMAEPVNRSTLRDTDTWLKWIYAVSVSVVIECMRMLRPTAPVHSLLCIYMWGLKHLEFYKDSCTVLFYLTQFYF